MKNEIIRIRVTKEEKETLKKLAEQDRRSLSDYLITSGLKGGEEMEEFRMNVNCAECGALIPQYIKRYEDGSWDTTENCSMCGYESPYNDKNKHGTPTTRESK